MTYTAPILALLGCALTLQGCSGARPVQTEVMLEHKNCQHVEAGVTPVSLDKVAKIRGSRLIRLDPNGEPAKPAPEQPAGVELYAISKGPMPTPGYGFTLEGTRLLEQTLTVQVGWETPAEDAVLAQMRTHPCLVIAVPVTDATLLIVQQGDTEIARRPLTPSQR